MVSSVDAAAAVRQRNPIDMGAHRLDQNQYTLDSVMLNNFHMTELNPFLVIVSLVLNK